MRLWSLTLYDKNKDGDKIGRILAMMRKENNDAVFLPSAVT